MLNMGVRRWIWRQEWTQLRDIQRNAIPEVIGADRDVILAAPTAGGKTEAAYLPILSNLLDHPVDGEGFAVLNISPLKALINDQHRRLSEIAGPLGVDVTPWHGDIAGSAKTAALRSPAGILVITPESLEAMMVRRGHQIKRLFGSLRYVVIDELHAFMGSERGIQLMSQLARVEHEIGRRVPRVALSATLSDYSQAVDYLRPRRDGYPVSVPSAGTAGHPTLVLVKEIEADQDTAYVDTVAEDIYRNLRGSSNLVFANSRKEAEGMAMKLRDLSRERGVPNEFVVHHGSLSRSDRRDVEQNLKQGILPLTALCTSTLELGIDIGNVRSIAQLVTANSVSALRQRLGRSGRRNEPSVLRVYSLDEVRDNYKYHLRTALVQNIAVISLLTEGRYEPVDMHVPHYSTLVQQTLSLLAQYGGVYPQDAWTVLCAQGAFTNITPDQYMQLLSALGEKGLVEQASSGQLLLGRGGERMVHQADFCSAFVTLKDYDVMDLATGRSIGVVQYMPYVGEYILLAARRWIVESIDERTGRISVNAAHTTGKHMFEGHGQEIDGLITRRMRQIYMGDEQYPYLDAETGAPEALAHARANFLQMGLVHSDVVEAGDSRLLFTWGGMRLNRTLALMRKADGHAMPAYDPFAVADVPAEYLERLRAGDYDPLDLARCATRGRRLTDKFDFLLPDDLLCRKYAASKLWVPGCHRQSE